MSKQLRPEDLPGHPFLARGIGDGDVTGGRYLAWVADLNKVRAALKPEENPGCGHPGCPVKQWRPPARDPRCVCGKPIMLCVLPGQHAHPCLVHPEYVIVGQTITC